MKLIDLTGAVFGGWTVIQRVKQSPGTGVVWECLCKCGRKKNVSGGSLRRGLSTSCGCNTAERCARTLENLSGRVYGRLTVTDRVSQVGERARWACVCACGGSTVAASDSLKARRTTSCGCVQKERASKSNRTHGMTGSPSYRVWVGMKNRCENPQEPSYINYGARGIYVDDLWHKFENFFADMGERPEGLTLDRKDNEGPYSKENCRWATPTEQARNRRSNIRVSTPDGDLCLKEMCEANGLNYKSTWAKTRGEQVKTNT